MNINKLNKKYKKTVGERKALEEQVAQYEGEKARAVAEAVAPLAAEIESLRELLKERSDCLEREVTEKQALAEAKVMVEGERDEWRRQAEEAAPSVQVAEEKVVALTALLDKVRDRMKRKDLEQEQAILNRKALVGAVPGLRRL